MGLVDLRRVFVLPLDNEDGVPLRVKARWWLAALLVGALLWAGIIWLIILAIG